MKGLEQYPTVGFSAQNITTVLPEGAPVKKDGYLGLNTTAILALTVNSVKELDTRTSSQISELESKISDLEAQIETLKAKQK